VDPKFFRRSFLKSNGFNTSNRNSLITSVFLDKTLRVYNGAKAKSFIVKSTMLGKKLGEFSITKVLGRDIALSKQLKAKAKKRK
jgi:ribosomal protein S19